MNHNRIAFAQLRVNYLRFGLMVAGGLFLLFPIIIYYLQETHSPITFGLFLTILSIQLLMGFFFYLFTTHQAYQSNRVITLKKRLETIIKRKNTTLEFQLHNHHITRLPNIVSFEKASDQDTEYIVGVIKIENHPQILNLYGQAKANHFLVDIGKFLENEIIQHNGRLFHVEVNKFIIYFARGHLEREEMVFLFRNIHRKLEEVVFEYLVFDLKMEFGVTAKTVVVFSGDSKAPFESANILIDMMKHDQDFLTYSTHLQVESIYSRNLNILYLFKKALMSKKITPFIQPIQKQDKTAYECLARITFGDKLIMPSEFLPLIETTKYIKSLTTYMIDCCFDAFANDANTEFSINITYSDIASLEFHIYLIDKLARYNNPSRVTFEIVESSKIANVDLLLGFITKIKVFDAKIAIDDFGAGYSNFTNLLAIKPDILKIDGSLIQSIDTDTGKQSIVKGIAKMCHEFEIEIVAEFVETQEELDYLGSIGIESYQGYFIGKPFAIH